MDLCKAPCAGYISREDYGKIIKGTMDLLKGKDKEYKRCLKKKWKVHQKSLEFEKAATFRDKIIAIDKIN